MAPKLSADIERFIKTNYQYSAKVHQDVTKTTSHYRSLIPKKETHKFKDGTSQNLLCLEGTIPVRYSGNVYNIPIRIWLLYAHPHHSPLCYVSPTSNMNIKVSRNVDESGRVFMPYLHEWSSSKGNLLGAIQAMISIFKEKPPVFTKPPPAKYSNPSANPEYLPSMKSAIDDRIRISLISEVQSRITERALEFEKQFKAEKEVLKKANEELVMGRNKIDSYMNQMGRDCAQLENSLAVLKEQNEHLKQMPDKDKLPDIDGTVTTTAPLYDQLLNAYAEENAIEDTIYYLGEGLRKGVIELDTFLKHVRELSRKEFMLRVLMQKCRHKAGLPL